MRQKACNGLLPHMAADALESHQEELQEDHKTDCTTRMQTAQSAGMQHCSGSVPHHTLLQGHA
jgi:hypothetical protein